MNRLPVMFLILLAGCQENSSVAPEVSSTEDLVESNRASNEESQRSESAKSSGDESAVGLTSSQLSVGSVKTNSVGIRLIPIPAGEFVMGSPEGDQARLPQETQHRVQLTKPYYLSATEVTQGQWQSVMGTEPWKGSVFTLLDKDYVKEGPDYAATYVSWSDAVAFCDKLSKEEGLEYRLPTESEWEYACRAGTTTRYSFGDDAAALGDYGWFGKNALDVDEKYAHRVGEKRPNVWGLYDMHGNVYEWCSDWYGAYPSGTVTDPKGPSDGSLRVHRGGGWFNDAKCCRSAYRNGSTPGSRNDYLGFRVCLSPSGAGGE